MKIRHIASSTVIIETKGIKILTDPWLVDGEYYGSWYHYPKLEFKSDFFDDIDFIYCSHIHPDHFSKKSFQLLNKDIPVLIHRYESDFLRKNIERLGFKVLELNHNKKHFLNKNVSITILAADNCNPQLCAKFFGCGIIETEYGSTQIDSLAIIDDGTYRVLNTNDCPYELAETTIKEALNNADLIDFLLVGYAGAGPFPQCFQIPIEEKKKAAYNKKRQFLNLAVRYIDLVKPRFYMPFAGTYTLAGKLSVLQEFRGVPELLEARSFLDNSEIINQQYSKSVLLNSFEYFDLEQERASKEFVPVSFSERTNYIKEILLNKVLEYEKDDRVTFAQIIEYIPIAHSRLSYKQKEIDFQTNTKVYISLPENKYLQIDFSAKKYAIVHEDALFSSPRYVLFELDYKLLLRILKGPRFAHWNNAEIGSHIKITRKPEIFERGIYYLMSYFHS